LEINIRRSGNTRSEYGIGPILELVRPKIIRAKVNVKGGREEGGREEGREEGRKGGREEGRKEGGYQQAPTTMRVTAMRAIMNMFGSTTGCWGTNKTPVTALLVLGKS
jgi:hypothetical protein